MGNGFYSTCPGIHALLPYVSVL